MSSMQVSMRRVPSMVVLALVFASACADEDGAPSNEGALPGVTLPGVAAGAPRSKVVVASTAQTTRVSLTPSSRPARSAQPPVFYRVQVREGDTVGSVARTYGIRAEYVVWNNEDALQNGELVEGALLAIPSVEGIIHTVRLGETLAEIATRYGVEVQAIIDFPSNGISSPTAVPGSTILVPGGRKP